MTQTSILHIGDLHFWRIPWNPFHLFNKRFLGVGNLVAGGRAKKFRQEMAPRLVERLQATPSDVLLFSGDFSSTALPAEFQAAINAFNPYFGSFTGSVFSVPGNHDCYLASEIKGRTIGNILGKTFNTEVANSLVQIAPTVELYRLNAATKNGLGSHGRVLPEHLEFAKEKMSSLPSETKALLVLCHFPPEDPPGVLHHDRGPQLRGSRELLEVLSSATDFPIYWLHGHHHHRWVYGSPTVGNLLYINAGAPLMRRKSGSLPDMGFHQLLLDADSHELVTHRFDHKAGQWKSKSVEWPKPGVYTDLQEW